LTKQIQTWDKITIPPPPPPPRLYFVMNDRDKVAKICKIQEIKVLIFKKIAKL
jgi:hypothetical protein